MKITGGKYNSIKIKAPTNSVRPTLSKIRESIFNILNTKLKFSEASFLDLFSGSGIMSLEAISRGFKKVVSVEKNYKTAQIIKENFSGLNLKPNLIIKDALKALDLLDNAFDVIYIDPPYENTKLYSDVLAKIAQRKLLREQGIIITECKNKLSNFDIPENFYICKENIYGDIALKFIKE